MAYNGGWASALGAAILGGVKGYHDASEEERQQGQFKLQQQEAQERLNNDVLQRAILKKQLDNLPQDQAQKKLELLSKFQGDEVFNNPDAVSIADQAGVPFNKTPNWNPQAITNARINAAENSSPAGAIDLNGSSRTLPPTTQQAASALGVAPNTGVQIPGDVQRKSLADDIALQQLKNFSSGGGYEMDPTTGLPANTARNRAIEVNDPRQTITKMYGPANESPEAVRARTLAQRQASAEVPPQQLQRVIAQMGEMTDNLGTAQTELEKMYPGIQNAVAAATDPKTGQVDWTKAQYNGLSDLAQAKLARTAYNYAYTPYNKAIQAASLGNVQGWSTIVPNRINPTITSKLQEHQSAFGNETPLATYQRNKELIALLKNNANDLTQPEQFGPTPVVPQRPAGPPPTQIGSVEAPPTAPGTAAPPAAVPVRAPSLAPAALPGSKTIKLSEIQAAMKPGEDLRQLIAEVKAQGYNVVGDVKPPQAAPTPAPFNPVSGLRGAQHIGPEPTAPSWRDNVFNWITGGK